MATTDITKQFLALLWQEGAVHEVRIISSGGIFFGYYDDYAQLAADAAAQSGTGNVYFTLNPVNADCKSRGLNRISRAGSAPLTKDAEISHRRTLLIDFDPERLSGIPSTDAEHSAALELASEVRTQLGGMGWPDPIMTDSGNGAGLLYRIDLPKDDGGLVKQVLEELAGRFSTSAVKIDLAVHNAARITRMPGTLNMKGDNRPERPHRVASVVRMPAAFNSVSREQLEMLAGETTKRGSTYQVVQAGEKFAISPWLKQQGIGFTEKAGECHGLKGVWYTLDYCPFKGPQHTDGNTGVFMGDDGRIFARCHHEKCKQENWRTLRRLLEPDFDARASQKALGGSIEGVRDSHRLARAVLEHFDNPEHRTLILSGDTIYSWDSVWTPLSNDSVKHLIWRVVKEEFDDFALKLASCGKPTQTPSVSTAIVNNVFGALCSLIEVRAHVGDWLAGDGPAADDLLICKNGILDLPRFVDGGTYGLLPHTSRLFVQNKLDFDFEATAANPERWLQFLNEVWPQDPGSRQLLQQYFGYALTTDVSQQKFLMLIGATRGGKGVITRLLAELVGAHNSCSIRLDRLPDEYSLANAVGKSLILIPDANLPRHDRRDSVTEVLKAITGGDVVDVNRKYKPVLSTALAAKIVITSNQKIDLPDNSRALHERMLVLPFSNSFASHPDTKLGTKLRAELPGVLRWAIEGWRSLRQNGRFIEPESSQALKEDLQQSGSPIQAFIAECCVIDSGARADKDEMFDAWKRFSKSRDEHPGAKSELGRKLFEAQPQIRNIRPTVDGKRVWLYTGIGLKASSIEDSTIDAGESSPLPSLAAADSN